MKSHAISPIRVSLVILLAVVSAQFASADPIIHVHDNTNQLATVDIGTGTVTLIGNLGADMLTDIAFDPGGVLFGISPSNLYTIDPNTAAVTLVGAHGIPTANALEFAADGTLYGAGTSTNLFTLNPATGQETLLGDIGFSSAGDLAFNGGDLFLSSSSDELIQIDLNAVSGASVGPIGFNNVFGLSTDDNGVLFGAAGTEFFTVNTGTGAGTAVLDYSGNGLGPAFGTAFAPAFAGIPEPSSLTLISVSALGLIVGAWRRRRRGKRTEQSDASR